MSEPLTFMRKMSDHRLDFGDSVRVFLRDGTERLAHCTHIVHYSLGEFTQWYDNKTRRGIDATQIVGWLPVERSMR